VVEGARAARRDDLARVAQLARAMRAELRALRGGALWAEREALAEPLEDAYAAFLDRDDACLLVGAIDDVVVGFAAVRVETLHDGARLGVVTDLFVEEPAREVGVGEAMVEQVLEFCSAAGCIGVDALALPGSRSAKNFFEESGFTARAIVMHRAAP
jgi:GNAT superfamily N-acetyltransferase